MPPAKAKPPAEDSRSDASTIRERQIAAAAHARKSKQQTLLNGGNGKDLVHGSALKDLASASADVGPLGQEAGVRRTPSNTGNMSWHTTSLPILDAYRTSHSLPNPAAFTTPLRQALLTNPGIGRQSPTMARYRSKRRVGREVLATAVRRHFGAMAVSEGEVVVEFVYGVKNRGERFNYGFGR
ncbi:hypothetical protein LTR95_004394 [Oleoguttula sp. CCFEE 5521]